MRSSSVQIPRPERERGKREASMCGVYIFWECVFPPGAPVSSDSPNTCVFRSDGNLNLGASEWCLPYDGCCSPVYF